MSKKQAVKVTRAVQKAPDAPKRREQGYRLIVRILREYLAKEERS